MCDHDRLKSLLRQRPILAAEAGGKVELIREGAATRRMLEDSCFMLHAENALRNFAKLTGRQIEFTRTDIARIAGIHPMTAYEWTVEGVIEPTIRSGEPGRANLYSYADAFAAGVCGSLSRQGMPRRTLGNVQRLFQPMLESASN